MQTPDQTTVKAALISSSRQNEAKNTTYTSNGG